MNEPHDNDSGSDPEDLDENAPDEDERVTRKLLEAVRLEIEALRAMLGLPASPSNPDHDPTEDDQ